MKFTMFPLVIRVFLSYNQRKYVKIHMFPLIMIIFLLYLHRLLIKRGTIRVFFSNDTAMRKTIISLLFVALFAIGAKAADGGEICDAVNKFNEKYPQETVFLHFDNTAYYLNEIIWWKAYVLRSDNGRLGSMSRVLYVELIDPAGEIVETKKCLIEDGCANGEFMLSKYTRSGLYEVRAYTRYMLNWGNECLFARLLPVFDKPKQNGNYPTTPTMATPVTYGVNTPKQLISKSANDSTNYVVRFFPEGGSLVKGLESRLAFEVTDSRGKRAETSGWIVYKNGKKSQVKTIMDGRGIFSYTPDNERANLRLKLPNGKYKNYPLPEAEDEGTVVTVDALSQDRISWKIQSSDQNTPDDYTMLLVHKGKARIAETPLMRNQMPYGCSQLTLVDKEGNILCSRMIFNMPKDSVASLSIASDEKTIWPSKKMKMEIKTEPNSSVSLSVCDAETQQAAEAHNAATWFLLGSELKGYVSHPEYYLENDDKEHLQASDLLMMVQGWRRYDVEAMSGKKAWKKTFPTERKLLIDGQIKPYSKRNKVDGVRLDILMTSMGSVLQGSVTTDSTGYYVFVVPDCGGEWEMSMSTSLNDKLKNYYVTVNRHFSPDTVREVTWPQLNDKGNENNTLSYTLDSLYIDSIPAYLRNHWLKEVEVSSHRIWKNPREYWERESRGALNASVRYDMAKAADEMADQGLESPTLVDWLLAKNSLFEGYDNITGEECALDANKNMYGDGLTYNGKGILWIVNNSFVCATGLTGYPAKDYADAKDYAPNNVYIPFDISDIKSVYVSPGGDDWKRFIYAPKLAGRGCATVFVYTKPNLNVSRKKGQRITTFKAYSIAEDYDRMMQLTGADIEGTDYRRTLYWNPNINIDSNGNGEIEFKSNSTTRHLSFSVAGFTKSGRPIILK